VSLGAQGYTLQIKAITERLQAVTDVGSARTALASVSMTDAHGALTSADTYLGDANTAFDEAFNYLDTDADVNVKAFLKQIATDAADLRTKIRAANDAMVVSVSDANTALGEAFNYLELDTDVNVKKFLKDIATDVAELRTKIRVATDAMVATGTKANTALDDALNYLDVDSDVNVKKYLKQIATDVAELRTKLRVAVDAVNSSLDEVDVTDFGTSEGVWAEEAGYVTGPTAPSMAKYLDDGDALINAATTGADVTKRYTEFVAETDKIVKAFDEKRKDALSQGQVRINQALGYVEEVRSRMSDLRAYIEQAHGAYEIVQGFVAEATGRIQMGETLYQEVQARMADLRGYIEQSHGAYELVQGFVSKAEGHVRTGEIHSQEAQARMADLRAYVEQAHGAYEIVQGFTQEGLGRVRMAETFVQECVQRLDMNRVYISEGERYLLAAERQGVIAEGFDTMAISKLREFRSQLKKADTDRRQEEQPQTFYQRIWND